MQLYPSTLQSDLEHYAERYPSERGVVQRMLQLLQNDTACFERTCFSPGHFTASAWIVNAKGDQILLTHHRKLNRWLQLGGHTDGDSNTLQAARREAREESGMRDFHLRVSGIFDVDIHPIPAIGSEPPHEHFDVRYALTPTEPQIMQISDESHDLRWIYLTELQHYTQEESMFRMARKWEAQLASAALR